MTGRLAVLALCLMLLVSCLPQFEGPEIDADQAVTMTLPTSGMSANYSPNGKSIVVNGPSGFQIWDATTGDILWERKSHLYVDGVWATTFSPDSSSIVIGTDDGAASIWDAKTGRQIGRLPIVHTTPNPIAVQAVVFSPDGKRIVTAGYPASSIWNSLTMEQVGDLCCHNHYVYAVAYSADGEYIVTGSEDNTARVWDAETGEEIRRLQLGSGVNSVTISPDNKIIATASQDGSVKVFDLEKGSELRSLQGHRGEAVSVAFSPNGMRLVSAGDDHVVRLWNTTTWKELARLRDDTGVVWSASFSPDGKHIVTAGDHSVRIWDVTAIEQAAQ